MPYIVRVRDRDDQPRDLPDRDPARPRRPNRRPIRSRERPRLERPPDLHLRRRLPRRLVPARAPTRAACSTTSCCRAATRVASSSLNVFGNNCNDLTAAETMMMVKERFIEALRPAALHDRLGLLGRLVPEHQIADNYPGLLDGIIAGCSFPGGRLRHRQPSSPTRGCSTTTSPPTPGAIAWTATSRSARSPASGVYDIAHRTRSRRIDRCRAPGSTDAEFDAAVPAAPRYDPRHQPDGARCDVYDHTVNVYGRDPANGFARRPLDNVGIQYGLRRAQRRHDQHRRPVPRPEREDRRLRHRRQHVAAAHRRRPARDPRAPTRPGASPTAAAGWRDDADHRLPRLQRRAGRRRHPRALPLVLDARAPDQGERPRRQPGHRGGRSRERLRFRRRVHLRQSPCLGEP